MQLKQLQTVVLAVGSWRFLPDGVANSSGDARAEKQAGASDADACPVARSSPGGIQDAADHSQFSDIGEAFQRKVDGISGRRLSRIRHDYPFQSSC